MKTLLIRIMILTAAIMLAACSGGGNCFTQDISQTVYLDPNGGGISNGQVNVSVSPVIKLKFTTVMNPVTVNTTTILLSTRPLSNGLTKNQSGGELIAITSPTTSDNQTFSFSPIERLSENKQYYITVQDTKTMANITVNGQFDFTTGDDVAPSVSLQTPTNGSSGVSLTPVISLLFSESVTGVNPQNVSLHANSINGNSVTISGITAGAGNNLYTLNLAESLASSTTYYLVVESAISDTANPPNRLATTVFNFTAGDFIAPQVTLLTPQNNSTGVSLTPAISMLFSESVAGVNPQNVSLHAGSSNGNPVIISGVTSGAGNLYTLNLAESLASSTTYYLVVESAISDAANPPNRLATTVFNFTTGDFIAPQAVMINPQNNSTGVAVATVIHLQFSESVQNVSTSSLTLHAESTGGLIVIADITNPSGNQRDYYLTPRTNLINRTDYYVVADNAITELSGNALVNSVFNFTTAWQYAYITNNESNNYTQCAVTRDGIIESASCINITPSGAGQLNIPSGIAFVGTYAYINNIGSNCYTPCNVGARGIESATCNTITPTGSGALNAPGGITFYGNYGYIANVNGNSYTQCAVDSSGMLQIANCNTVTPSGGGALNMPRSIGFSGTYAYIVNGGDDSYTQCNVAISGIDLASCIKVTPIGTGALHGPYEIAFHGGYAYFTNGFSMLPETSYTQCSVTNGLIDSTSCNTVTPLSPGALMIPVGIAFSGSYVYLVNHANDAGYPPVGGNYTQCNVNNSRIDAASCNTISLPTGILNLPGGIAIH